METLARWVPTTPEMEAKVLFGRHVWDCARHADLFGKRAFELRAPLHYTLPAQPEFRAWLAAMSALAGTAERLSAFYGTVGPTMVAEYRRYVENSDPLMDEPTVRIIEELVRDHERMAAEYGRLAGALSGLSLTAQPAPAGVPAIPPSGMVAHSQDNRRARGVSA